MAEKAVVIYAHEQGLPCFTQRQLESYVGRAFPVTDSKGVELAEAQVISAAFLDAEGLSIALRFYVPDEVLEKDLESDVGRMVRR